jgi:hypothetical protein
MANAGRSISALVDDADVVDDEIRNLQSLLGIEPDGYIGPLTRAAATARGEAASSRAILTAVTNVETTLMTLKDDVAALKASWSTFLTNFTAYQTSVNTAVAAAVAADEAGNDVDVTALKSAIDAANASIAPAAAAATSVAATPASAT